MSAKNIAFGLILWGLASCGGNEKKNLAQNAETEAKEIAQEGKNIISQQKPTLMVVPSDALLKRLGCLKDISQEGKTTYTRDYTKAFAEDSNLKFAITGIEGKFAEVGFSLENLEQTLKQIANEKAQDEIDNIEKDLKTVLLNTARPDIILELDYEMKPNTSGRNYMVSLTYNLSAMDAFTNKTVAAAQSAGTNSQEEDVAKLLGVAVSENLPTLQKQIQTHFADLIKNGKEITLRLNAEQGANFSFSQDCGNEEVADAIRTWLKENAKNATFKAVKSTDKELRFTSVRIPTHTKEGKPYSAHDFANDLRKAVGKTCKLKFRNQTQSIGDAYLTVKAE
jgi:hypothetical protein